MLLDPSIGMLDPSIGALLDPSIVTLLDPSIGTLLDPSGLHWQLRRAGRRWANAEVDGRTDAAGCGS